MSEGLEVGEVVEVAMATVGFAYNRDKESERARKDTLGFVANIFCAKFANFARAHPNTAQANYNLYAFVIQFCAADSERVRPVFPSHLADLLLLFSWLRLQKAALAPGGDGLLVN